MTFQIIQITGHEAFDYFFTLNFMFGIIAIGPAIVFKLFKY